MKSILFVLCLITSLIAVPQTHANAADNSVWLEKSQATTPVNQLFDVPIWLETIDPANAIEMEISYPEELKFVGVSTQGSAISLWVELPHSVGSGTLRLIGGAPNPGFTKGKVWLSQISFVAAQAGLYSIGIQSVHLLANDGLGSDLRVKVQNLNVLIDKLVEPALKVVLPQVLVPTEVIPQRQTDSWTVPLNLA